MSDAWIIGICSGVVTILCSINGIIMYLILGRLDMIEKRQDTLQTKEGCKEIRETCQELQRSRATGVCTEARELWEAFDKHSHTSLPITDKVTR